MSDNFDIFIGIDPGKSGCVAALMALDVIALYPTPTDGKEYNIKKMQDILEPFRNTKTIIIIERAQAMPKQGVCSMFEFGKGYGIWLGILSCLGKPYIVVHSRTWTKRLLEGAPGEKKMRNFYAAERLFPQWKPKLKKEYQYSDALLLAEYGRRLYSNIPTIEKSS